MFDRGIDSFASDIIAKTDHVVTEHVQYVHITCSVVCFRGVSGVYRAPGDGTSCVYGLTSRAECGRGSRRPGCGRPRVPKCKKARISMDQAVHTLWLSLKTSGGVLEGSKFTRVWVIKHLHAFERSERQNLSNVSNRRFAMITSLPEVVGKRAH